jgi:hypothetical protein
MIDIAKFADLRKARGERIESQPTWAEISIDWLTVTVSRRGLVEIEINDDDAQILQRPVDFFLKLADDIRAAQTE